MSKKLEITTDTPMWEPNATFPEAAMVTSRMEAAIVAGVRMGQTVQMLGPHGIGKTQTVTRFVPWFFGARVVRIAASNLAPEDLITTAPVMIDTEEGAHMALRELLIDSIGDVKTGEKIYIFVDDSLQAGMHVQNAIMQMACNWTLGSFDLRKDFNVIGILLSDNESLQETAARRTDLALLDRMLTPAPLTAADTSWKQALAARYPDIDLTEVFKIRAEMPAEVRTKKFSPRSLEHVLDNLTHGNPGIWGLPILNGHRVRLHPDGATTRDRTTEYLDKIASAIKAPNPDKVADPVRRVVRQAIENRWAILLQGDPGGGKTEVVKDVISSTLGVDPLKYYWSMSTTDVEQLCVPIPSGHRLTQLLREDFYSPEAKAFIWDEFNRPKDPASFAKLMEVTQEWTIAGKEIPNLVAQIAIQNPPLVMGRKLSVSKYNIAQADRFTAALEIGPNDIPANDWLLTEYPKKYARQVIEMRSVMNEPELDAVETHKLEERLVSDATEVVEHVLEWYKHDIDDEARNWVTARGRERLCNVALQGDMDLDYALIYLGDGERAPVTTTGLRARLDERPFTGLRDIVENFPLWVDRLTKAKADAQNAALAGYQDEVHMALQSAELTQLNENRDKIMALIPLIPTKYRVSYLSTAPDRQAFFIGLLSEMGNKASKAKK